MPLRLARHRQSATHLVQVLCIQPLNSPRPAEPNVFFHDKQLFGLLLWMW